MNKFDDRFINIFNILYDIKDRIKDSEYMDMIDNITEIRNQTKEIIDYCTDDSDGDEVDVYEEDNLDEDIMVVSDDEDNEKIFYQMQYYDLIEDYINKNNLDIDFIKSSFNLTDLLFNKIDICDCTDTYSDEKCDKNITKCKNIQKYVLEYPLLIFSVRIDSDFDNLCTEFKKYFAVKNSNFVSDGVYDETEQKKNIITKTIGKFLNLQCQKKYNDIVMHITLQTILSNGKFIKRYDGFRQTTIKKLLNLNKDIRSNNIALYRYEKLGINKNIFKTMHNELIEYLK